VHTRRWGWSCGLWWGRWGSEGCSAFRVGRSARRCCTRNSVIFHTDPVHRLR
jgi:hypothetical protein